jgi:hypothetical protein
MKIRLFLTTIGILSCVWAAGAADRATAPKSRPHLRQALLASRPVAENPCLACHSYSKIIEATAGFVAPSGEKSTPHKYVPHDSKKDDEIPECANCHTAHALDPLPAKGSLDRSKVNVQWCYTACHHEKDLKSCKQCHP